MSRKRMPRRRTASRMNRSSGMRQSKQLSFDQLEARHLLATLVVNSTVDGPVNLNDSVVTLRDAIEAANNDVLVAPGGETGSGTDTITFDTSVFSGAQTINLTSQLPTITDSLTITGAGANLLTIDAGNGTDDEFDTGDGFRIFNINDGDNGNQIDVTLSGLTLTGGDPSITDNSADGGAILNREILLLSGSVVSGNASLDGGGIYNSSDGTLVVTSSTLSGNLSEFGGGITNRGTATITNSTLSDNSAGQGGGIANSGGTATVTNSTLSNNSSSGNGGGIFSSFNSAVTITNSTLSGNSASNNGGGIYNTGGTAIVTSSTLSGNSADFGGGISNRGTATITNSIVANSSGGDLENNTPDNFFTGSFNLIGDGQDLGGLTGTITGDPLLGPLAFNAGPTETHALLPGSPAINAGDDNVTQTEDQRGLARNFNGVDIGAFELQPVAPIVTSFTRDEGGTLDTLARPDLLSTISVSFNVDVSVSADDLEIRNDTLGGSLVNTSGLTFSYDASTQTATWDFSSLTLDAGFYSFELSSDIASVDGNSSLGGAFSEEVYVALAGDANLDGRVDVLNDAFILVNNLGVTGGTWTQGDFNGTGTVDVLGDAFILINNLGQSVQLPATSQTLVQPPLATITSTPTPSTSAVAEQADDEDEVVATAPRVAVNATSPELSGDQVRDDAFASFGSLDSFWI